MAPRKVPRYRSIADGLIQDIVAGRYAVGGSLPSEAELCERLQVSRHTMREALRILEDGGLISRRRGSGSEVVASTPPVRFRQNVDSIEDLLQYGNESRLQLLSTREVAAAPDVAARLGCAAGTPSVELVGLRTERGEHGRPFALTRIWFPPQSPRRRERLLQPASALKLLLDTVDARTLGHVEQTFTAVALDADAARWLRTRKGAPSLRADRSYHDRRGRLLVVATSWHRADLFRYSTVLRHEAG